MAFQATKIARVGFVFVIACSAQRAHAQLVLVNDGQVLSEDELNAGFFDDGGQAFTLGPAAFFNIIGGGVIGPVGNPFADEPFDFLGSTVNLFGGGRFDAPSAVSNLTLNLFDGSEIDFGLETYAGSVVNLSGGRIGRGFEADSSEVNISGGSIESFSAGSNSVVTMSGGRLGNASRISDGTVLNMSDGNIGSSFSANRSVMNISGGNISNISVSSETEINLTGGRIGDNSQMFANSVFNISGGTVGDDFTAFMGSGVVNISGGGVGGRFTLHAGTEMNLAGGYIGSGLSVRSGGLLTITGGEFQRNGKPVSQLNTDLGDGEIFTGTLADGSVFIFADDSGDFLADGSTTLQSTPLDPADTTPMVVSTGNGPTTGLREGQTLTLRGDATLRDHFAAVGATLNIEGGTVGESLETAYSDVTISGGTIGPFMKAYAGSDVHISGGTVDDGLRAFSGSQIHVSGGETGDFFFALEGSTVTISGGSVGGTFVAGSGSEVSISGGHIGREFAASGGADVDISGATFRRRAQISAGSDVTFVGGEFMLNGTATPDLAGGLGDEDIFTGTLADGSVFIFASDADDRISAGTTTLQSVPLEPADTTPRIVSTGEGPKKGLRQGQILILRGDGTLRDDFAVVGATLDIEGGSVGADLEAAFSEINVTGGSIGQRFGTFSGSEVNISGGSVGDGFRLRHGSVVNFSGGSIGAQLLAFAGSELNILGTEFFLDGVEITGLTPGQEHVVTERGFELTGILVDGSSFGFDLNAGFRLGEEFFEPGSLVTITRVPSPGTAVAIVFGSVLIARRRRREATTIAP